MAAIELSPDSREKQHFELSHPSIAVRRNLHGIQIIRLHYSVDPEKSDGEKTLVPELRLQLSPWALKQFQGMTDKAMHLQEYKIDFGATLGQKVFHLDKEPMLCKSFPVPPNWTRYFSLDPHLGVPHACLCCAVDPWATYAYRELWPSKAHVKLGSCPSDDNRYRIRHYVETIYYLESNAVGKLSQAADHASNLLSAAEQPDSKLQPAAAGRA